MILLAGSPGRRAKAGECGGIFERFRSGFVYLVHTPPQPHLMITVLLFTGLCLGLVCLVVTDCQAHHHTPSAKDSPKDRAARD